jgi:hypothetical protein
VIESTRRFGHPFTMMNPCRMRRIDALLGRPLLPLRKWPGGSLCGAGTPAALGAAECTVPVTGRAAERDAAEDLCRHIESGRAHAMFGPGAPEQYDSIGERSAALTAALACSPCADVLNHRTSPGTKNQCMQAISVDTALAAMLAGVTPPIGAEAKALRRFASNR